MKKTFLALTLLSFSFAAFAAKPLPSIDFSKAIYGLQPQLNSNYLQQVYGIESTQDLPLGLILNNTFNYTINTGRADGYNIKMPIWNLSMAKGFLKNSRAEIKFSIYDLLNKYARSVF